MIGFSCPDEPQAMMGGTIVSYTPSSGADRSPHWLEVTTGVKLSDCSVEFEV